MRPGPALGPRLGLASAPGALRHGHATVRASSLPGTPQARQAGRARHSSAPRRQRLSWRGAGRGPLPVGRVFMALFAQGLGGLHSPTLCRAAIAATVGVGLLGGGWRRHCARFLVLPIDASVQAAPISFEVAVSAGPCAASCVGLSGVRGSVVRGRRALQGPSLRARASRSDWG